MRERMKGKAGQAIIILAVMVTLLFGAIGLAVDVAVGYLYSIAAERAAASGALAGVIFMPNQLSPCCSGNDATDRAIAEAKQNGFDTADVANNVAVSVGPVPLSGASCPCYTDRFQVTVSRTVRTFFMQLFGISQYTVSRTAQAGYLPPIALGQPGAQFGAMTSQIGTPGWGFVGNIESWNNTQLDGDAYQPNPVSHPNNKTDVHPISHVAGTEPSYANLSDRGGYNYLVTIGAGGGQIQVYNAVFGPDNNTPGVSTNNCDNHQNPPGTWDKCSPNGNDYLGEEYAINFSDKTTFAAIRYTVFQVSNLFIRSSDVMKTQMTVLPIDATNWSASPPVYCIVTGQPCTGWRKVTQTYDALGNATNMLIYHAWADIANYNLDANIVSYAPGLGPYGGALPAGTYRLRVDTLNWDGSVQGPGSNSLGAHSFSVRVTDALGNLCATSACGTVSAWKDMAWFTSITSSAFPVYLFQLPPDYAGKTITVDIYDPGDIHGGYGDIYLDLLDPTGATTTVSSINNLGYSRVQPGSLIAGAGPAHVRAFTSGGVEPFDGQWIDFQIPVSPLYNPGANPNNWWWSLKYSSALTPPAVGFDALTTVVGLKGNPAHLIQG